MQDEDGQVEEAESISAGPRLSRRRPEHAHLAASAAELRGGDRPRGPGGLRAAARTEGIIPALGVGARHRVGQPRARARGQTVLVNLSGRGDKDVAQVARLLGADLSGTEAG